MKKLFLLSTLTLLAACGNSNNTAAPTTSSTTTTTTQTTTTTAAATLKTISSSTNNLAVKTSSKWIKISQTKDIDLELSGHTQKAYLGFKLIDKKESVATNLDDAAQLGFEGSTSTMEYDKELDIKADTIANMPARYAQFQYTFKGVDLEVLLFIVDAGDNYIYIVSTNEKGIYAQIAEEIKTIINSVHKP